MKTWRSLGLLALPALVLSAGVLIGAWVPAQPGQIGFGVAPALALSASNQVEPPRVFPAQRAPKNARIVVLFKTGWLGTTFPNGKPADARLELSDGLGQVPQRQASINAGRDGVIASPERALAPGPLRVSLAVPGSSVVELTTLLVEDRVDEHAPAWAGPISVEGRAGIREAALWRTPQVELRGAVATDRDSARDELLYEINARSLSYGVKGSTTLFYPLSDSGTLAGNWCFIDSYGVDVRGVDASIRIIDAAGHGSASYRFAGACERGTGLFPVEAPGRTRRWLATGLALCALGGLLFIFWRFRLARALRTRTRDRRP